jgi:hypothetical protein
MKMSECTIGRVVLMPSGLLAQVVGPAEDGPYMTVEYEDGPPPWQPPEAGGKTPRSVKARTADMAPELLRGAE